MRTSPAVAQMHGPKRTAVPPISRDYRVETPGVKGYTKCPYYFPGNAHPACVAILFLGRVSTSWHEGSNKVNFSRHPAANMS